MNQLKVGGLSWSNRIYDLPFLLIIAIGIDELYASHKKLVLNILLRYV
jgi:hypothetical protein